MPSAGGYLVEQTETTIVPKSERTEFWRDLVSSYHCAMEFEFPDRRDFHSRTVRQRTANYQLVGWSCQAYRIDRTAAAIRGHPDENYRLLLARTGELRFAYGEQRHLLGPGSGALLVPDQPYTVEQVSTSGALVLTIPRTVIEARLGHTEQNNRRIELDSGLGGIIARLMAELCHERAVLGRKEFDAIAARLAGLLCLLLRDDAAPSDRFGELEGAVVEYVRAHLADPDLNGSRVAKALGWSLRQIQLALHQSGTTPRELIKRERLELARERLQHPDFRRHTITGIAIELGFGSASTFSTAFREHFGHSPSELR